MDITEADYHKAEIEAIYATRAWLHSVLYPKQTISTRAPASRRPAASYRGARRNQWRQDNAKCKALKDSRKAFGLSRSQFDRLRWAASNIHVRQQMAAA